jgi:hypothetical protein
VDIDIDGLHSTLEASPNDVDALQSLLSFYRSEGAIEELTELYLSQLEKQTEHRLHLYQGLADIMERELDLGEDARVVVCEGLQEFPLDPDLWDKLKRLSNEESQLLDYVEQLKSTALNQDSSELVCELIPLISELSDDELMTLSHKVHDLAISQHTDAIALLFWSELSEQRPDRIGEFLANLIDIAIELESVPVLKSIGNGLSAGPDDVFIQYVSAVKNLTIAQENRELCTLLTQHIDTANEARKVQCVSAILDLAIDLNHPALLAKIQPSLDCLSAEDFRRYLQVLSQTCETTQSLEALTELLAPFATWSEPRQVEFLTALKNAAVDQADVRIMLELMPSFTQLSTAEQDEFQRSIESLLPIQMNDLLFEHMLESSDQWTVTGFAHLLTEIYFAQSSEVTIRTRVEQWLLVSAPAEQLDAFVERFISESDDFDEIALLMRRRGQACAERNEPNAVKRHWQERALSLNPSATGLHDYFEEPRILDKNDLRFLSSLAAHEQTDPRIGMQIALRAMAFERDTDEADGWTSLLTDNYRRSQTYDADHQRAIEHLKTEDKLSLAAELLKEFATIEKDPII